MELLERIFLCACLFPCIYAFSCCLDQFPQRSLSSSPSGLRPGGFSFPKAGAKVRPSALPAKLFHIFFRGFFTTRCVSVRKNLGHRKIQTRNFMFIHPNDHIWTYISCPQHRKKVAHLPTSPPPLRDSYIRDSSKSTYSLTPSEQVIRPRNPSISCRR